MALLTPVLGLRNNARFLKLPPYISLVCILIGVAWLLLLPLDEYSRRTYISENALLPGQVHTYFGGSEHNVFRAYRHEVAGLANHSGHEVARELGEIFKSHGLVVAHQKYRYESAGKTIAGENVYAVLKGPRADATEAIVLIGAWRNMDGVLNQSGVALVLALARYFKRWSLWSKDIIFVITEDSTAGPQAWVDAYHSTHDRTCVDDLPIKGGALQGALAIDYPAGPGGHRFDKLHIIYDGVNGQLPNLDLFNTVAHITTNHMGNGPTLQRMWKHGDTYMQRLETILRGMVVQGLGHASGPHSSFIPYHVDAVTLQTVGDGWNDEMSLGRVVESTFRSLNNLLEHLHQSFFFYLLMHAQRFVSIGTYLPSAMLVAVNFTIMSIAFWVQSGRPTNMPHPASTVEENNNLEKQDVEVIEHNGMVAMIPKEMLATEERNLFLPLAFVCGAHFIGLIPLYLFHSTSASFLPSILQLVTITSTLLPYMMVYFTALPFTPTTQTLTLIPCTSLLLLGISLSTLSTLNFPLGLLVGLLASPLSFTHSIALAPAERDPRPRAAAFCSILLHLVSPTTVLYGIASLSGMWAGRGTVDGVQELLVAASDAWRVNGTWTAVVVWLVWWPAWFVGQVTLACEIFGARGSGGTMSKVSALDNKVQKK